MKRDNLQGSPPERALPGGLLTRTLVYIPIVHTQVEMGSVAASLKKVYLEQYGEDEWSTHIRVIDQMWEGIRRRIEALHLDYPRTRLYQDGLPICGKELDIVTEVARRGSQNHQILLDLSQKGCCLTGTESPQLLLQEYDHLKEALGWQTERHSFWRRLWAERVGQRLLRRRDQFIARRVDETLKRDETGILFVGLKHEVDRYLPKDISVRYLFHRLPLRYLNRFSVLPANS